MAAILTPVGVRKKLDAVVTSNAQQVYIDNFYTFSSRKMWSSFQILKANVQQAMLQDHLFEMQEISNVLEPRSSLGSADRKYCHSTDPRKCWQIVLLYTWKYCSEWNLSPKWCAFCCMNLLHFSVVSTALLLEMTECKCHGLRSPNPMPS